MVDVDYLLYASAESHTHLGMQSVAPPQSPARALPPTLDSTDWSDYTGIDEVPPSAFSYARQRIAQAVAVGLLTEPLPSACPPSHQSTNHLLISLQIGNCMG